MKKLISIIIPAYNESENLAELHKRIRQNIDGLTQYDFEIIIIENGSTDDSMERLSGISRNDKRFKIIQLSRNFGSDNPLTVGLLHASGDAAILMNADLQDPPEMLEKFIEKWKEGFEIVYGIVKSRKGTAFSRRISTSLFYKVINFLTKGVFPRDVSDFRILDRQVYLSVNQMPERNRFLRGMIIWTGFRQAGIPFERPPRFAGESKADFRTVFKLAMDGIFSFSYFPLRVITALGILLAIVSFVMLCIYVALFFILGREVPGFTTLITIVLFMFGTLFFILGIIGEYIARIYDETKQRPNFIIKRKIGF